ncbi:MAG TPA: monovalent cation/H(+) antiporter subunit G [Candidatus Limnocylindrales bacterium]|nr:monovalent cation/H(+) antiporter subunit G [Candidatus Limnocylindrales bacterium]
MGAAVVEILTALCLIGGTFFTVVACVGLVRLPDIYCRMHAAGKAGTLGVALMILAVAIWFAAAEPGTAVRALLAILFQFFTTPAATHVLSRAAYLTGYPRCELTIVDELRSHFPAHPFPTRGEE